MDDYLNEVEQIRNSRKEAGYKSDEDVTSKSDEHNDEDGSLMALSYMGLDNLTKQFAKGQEIGLNEEHFFTSNRRYTRLLAEQITTLNAATIRRKQKSVVHRDVRDIFSGDAKETSVGSSDTTPGPKLKKRFNAVALIKRSFSTGPSESRCVERRSNSSGDTRRKSVSESLASSTESLDETDDMTFSFEFFQSTEKRSDNGTVVRPSSVISASSDIDFPVVSIKKIPEGVTQIEDLSPEDLSHVSKLAFLELLDQALPTVSLLPKKHKKKHKDMGFFGVPLDYILECDRRRYPEADLKIPVFIAKLIDHLLKTGLEVEGVLRVSGSIAKIKSLAAEYDEIQRGLNGGIFDLSEIDPIDATGLFKKFLREVPVPLLYWDFESVYEPLLEFDDKKQLLCLQFIFLNLPQHHRNLLLVILHFVSRIVAHSATNRMTLSNVAMILAPNLFPLGKSRRPSSSSPAPHSTFLTPAMAEGMTKIVRLLIVYQHIVCTIPPNLITTLRKDTERRKNKGKDNNATKDQPIVMMKFRMKKDNKYSFNHTTGESNSGIDQCIHVLAPDFTKSSARVPLTPDLTAQQAVQQFFKKKESILKERSLFSANHSLTSSGDMSSIESLRLYEIGGNIGERCLHPDVNMIALFKLNSSAEWRIKPHPDYTLFHNSLQCINDIDNTKKTSNEQLQHKF